MAIKKYVWKFDLEEYLMTKDVKEDFAGKVKPIQTFRLPDVAREVAKERTEYRVDTLEIWFSSHSTQLKQSRTLTYDIPLVVGGSGGGEDDCPVIE